MSEPQETNVDLPVVLETMRQLQVLSTSLHTLNGQLQAGGDLGWTGNDADGTTLNQELSPAEQAAGQTVQDASDAVDGVISNLGATAGIWVNTEGTNVDLNG